MGDEFGVSTDNLPSVYIFWGTGEIDRTGENQWNSTFIGELGFDDNFDISVPEAQQYMFDLCQELKTKSEFVVQDDDVVDCWMETFKTLVEA